MIVEVQVYSDPPPSLERKAKKSFADSGVNQIFTTMSRGVVYSYLYGKHFEECLFFGRGPKRKMGGYTLRTALESMRRGIEVFSEGFHFRHHLNDYSAYLTYSVVEEEWSVRANKLEAAHIRALLDMNPIQVYDLTAKTAKLRSMCTAESAVIGYERFLKKNH